MGSGSRVAWASVAAGVGSVVSLPLAVYLTRFSGGYELLHAGFAIPVTVLLGFAAVALARRAGRRRSISLTGSSGTGVATAGRVLGVVGICMAASALVALGVYGLLEYVGTRE